MSEKLGLESSGHSAGSADALVPIILQCMVCNALSLHFASFYFFCNRVLKCDVTQKNKFVKLWDLVPFSSKVSLEKGPCLKLPLNCIFQPKYKG